MSSPHDLGPLFERASALARAAEGGRCRWLNASAREFLGLSEGEVAGFDWEARVHPEDRAALEAACGAEGDYRLRYRLRRGEGDYYWLDERGVAGSGGGIATAENAGPAEAGKAGVIQLASFDQHLPSLKILCELNRIGTWELDLEVEGLSWSAEVYRIHGVPEGQPVTLAEGLGFYPPGAREEVQRHLDRAVASGEPFDFELPIVDAQGARRWVRSVGCYVEESSRRLLRGCFQDVTEERERQLEVQGLNERMRIAAEAAQLGIFDWEVGENLLTWDETMYGLYGVDPGLRQDTFATWYACLHPHDAERVAEEVEASLRGAAEFDTRYRILRADTGEVRVIRACASVQRDPEGQARRMIGVNFDVTTEVFAEERSRQLSAELDQARRAESLATLAGGIAHNFNNVLGVVRGVLELLRTDCPPQPHLLRLISRGLDATDRAARVVEQVQSLNQAPMLSGERLNVSRLVREVGAGQAELHESGGPWEVEGHEPQLRQLVLCLLDNARKAVGPEGRVSMALGATAVSGDPSLPAGDYVELVVSDDGPGVPVELRERIFEPFFSSQGLAQGRGLGLSVAHGIAEAHGGRLRLLDSEIGACFQVLLPRAAASEGEVTEAPAHRRLVVVDDDEDLLWLVGTTLERAGYKVESFNSGVRALERIRRDPSGVDLVLSDVAMPELDGAAMTRALRRDGFTAPVVLMSGYNISKSLAADLDVDCLLDKPIPAERLLSAIAEALA